MKKALFFVSILLFCVCSNAQNAGKVTIHTKQLEMFNNLMNYSEEKAGGSLDCKRLKKSAMKAAYAKNINDSRLEALIDSLLNSPAYSPEIVKNDRTFRPKRARGIEAYRVGLTVLPDFCINMTAGMNHYWVEYWNSNYRHRADSALAKLKENESEIIQSIILRCKTLLPDDTDMRIEIDIYIIVDGNRGAFQTDNMIVLDAVNTIDLPQFINLLTHEMHHAYYLNWFDKRTSDNKHNKRYLFEYQRGFIFEGIAQLYGYDDYSPELKQMYSDKALITELFDEWISMMRKLDGAFPKLKYSMYQMREYKNAAKRMDKYYPGKIDSYAGRPTAMYYLSYNIYNSIFERGGHVKLKYVIENPDKLLSVYNELNSESMFVPQIPDDVVALWQDNL